MRHPTRARHEQLRPAMITLIGILSVQLGLEERAIDDTGWKAAGARQRSLERVKVRAIARAGAQAILRAADGRGFLVLRILHPIIKVL